MDVLAWIWWLAVNVLWLVASIVWFLLSGWVSALVQILVVVGGIFVFNYGWRRAPLELASRVQAILGMSWGWIRRREPRDSPPARELPRRAVVRRRRPGDINLSTVLNLAMLIGLALLGLMRAG